MDRPKKRLLVFLRAAVGLHLLATALGDQQWLEKVCPNSLAVGDPACLNGGTLHAPNNTDYTSCAYCECPKGWQGAQCGLCTEPSLCPEKLLDDGVTKVKAVSCTNSLIQPTDYEFSNGIGKEMSCFCGGPDETTQYACAKQPGTNLQISIVPPTGNSSYAFSLKVLQRAGTPSQDFTPDCYDDDGNKLFENCLTKERYRYAYAQIWEGDFQECSWTVGDCIDPLTGSDCINYECEFPTIECPPSYVTKCPGWSPLSCGNPPNEEKPYWAHHCSPLAIPFDDVPIEISCKPQLKSNGAFQCYMKQMGLPVASVGLECYTGTCVYPHIEPTPQKQHSNNSAETWFVEHSNLLLICMMWCLFLVVLIIAYILIKRDRNRSIKRMQTWEKKKDIRIVGSLSTTLVSDGEGALPTSSTGFLYFDSIHYTVQMKKGVTKRILTNISGLATRDSAQFPNRAGSLMAIMGPSGAGKTSLLDVLSGNRSKGVSGQVCIDGQQYPAGSRRLMSTSGYVHQEDILPGTLTVFEYLLFHATLRLPKTISAPDKELMVFSVIKQLGLEKVSHNFIGDEYTRGLSGGEKRRVSISCELLASPKIMFLDEPTTGLDSTNAAKVVEILSNMATNGITCLMTIHQPRSDVFKSVDRVLLLSGNGQMVFGGLTSVAEAHFEALGYTSTHRTVHIVDHMLDVAIKSTDSEVQMLVDMFESSEVHRAEIDAGISQTYEAVTVGQPKYRANFLHQLRCLSTRLLRNASRHPVLIAVNFVANVVVAVVIGVFFFNTGKQTEGIQSRLGALFFIILFLSMMSLSSMPVWRDQKLLFLRERAAGIYGTPAYLTSVLIFDLIPLRVLPPIMFTLISYWMIGLHPNCTECILGFTLAVIQTNVVATLMSMMIGAAFSSSAVANTIGSMVIMVSFLFGGFLLSKNNIPRYCAWVAKLSYFAYGYEALVVNEFHRATNFVFTAPVKSVDLPPLRVTGDLILCEFGFKKENFTLDILVLVGVGIACILATYVLLEFSDYALGVRLREVFLGLQPPMEEKIETASSLQKEAEEEKPAASVETSEEEESSCKTEPEVTKSLLDSSRAQDASKSSKFGPQRQPDGQQWGIRFPSSEITIPQAHLVDDSITLAWSKVSCTVWSNLLRKSTRILDNVCGIAGPSNTGRSGSVLFAIMGPSGSGKTTLMDIIAGRKRDRGVTCQVGVNGLSVSAQGIRKLSGYVLQDDVLPGTSTVLECIMFHAQLRMPDRTPSSVIRKQAQQVCSQLGLEKVMHSFIGDSFVRGLSGGEKRRVSIGCELLANPKLVFLDEPTTGLDSSNAAKVVDILSEMAACGITVIMTIHQPRARFLSLINRMLMLSENGQVVYTGSTEMASDHLASLQYYNQDESLHTADYMLDLIIKSPQEVVDELVKGYNSSSAYTSDQQWIGRLETAASTSAASENLIRGGYVIPKKYEASHFKQLKVLSTRMGHNMYRHPLLVLLNSLSSVLVSIGVGAVYLNLSMDTPGIQNRLGSLFFILMYFSLMSLSSMPLWHEGRLLFVRERASGLYGTTSYFLSILFFDILPMRILPPIIFGLISSFMMGLKTSATSLLTFVLVVILVNVAASTSSMAIGAAIPSTSIANMVSCLFILCVALLGGFFIGRKQMESSGIFSFVGFLSRFSYMRYAYEALMVNEFQGAIDFFLTVSYHCLDLKKDPRIAIEGDEILATFGFPSTRDTITFDIFMLCLFVLLHLGIMFLLVKWKNRPGEQPLHHKIIGVFRKHEGQ